MSLLSRFRNLSRYQGKEYAYNVNADGVESIGGSIYDSNNYTAIRPVKYMDENGDVHDFTDKEASDPAFANLIIKSGNAYTFSHRRPCLAFILREQLYEFADVRYLQGYGSECNIYSGILLWTYLQT